MPTCTKCNKHKPDTSFHKRVNGALQSHCKDCVNSATRERRRASGDAYRKAEAERKRKHYWENREDKLKQNRAKHLLYKYGIDEDEYERMFNQQDGLCAICQCVMDKPCIDHCHSTGKVRGLLCNSCNTGIGLLKEDKTLFVNAIAYLDFNA